VIFTTWAFAAFAVVTMTIYATLVPARARRPYLVLAGALFYAYAVPAYLLLVVELAAITYAAAFAMTRVDPVRRRPYFILGTAIVLGALGTYKYAHFFDAIVSEVERIPVVPLPNLIVPLAISFFTFEFVHVLIDAYRGDIEKLDPLDFALFVLFFPTLVAGPIKRYESFAPQFHPIVLPVPRAAMLHLYRIAIGIAKKLVIADSMSAFTGPIAHPGLPYGRPDYLVAVLAYSVKIYFDFSGYSDIAIGLAGILGLRIPENFDRPYRATNISQFWRRWHASLSSWVRDYVFIPLGGSRGSPLLTTLNLLGAMAVIGLWHGAAWTFVVWGLYHGMGLAIHRAWSANVVPHVASLRSGSIFIAVLSRATTFAFVACGWVFFAATSLANAGLVFRSIF